MQCMNWYGSGQRPNLTLHSSQPPDHPDWGLLAVTEGKGKRADLPHVQTRGDKEKGRGEAARA